MSSKKLDISASIAPAVTAPHISKSQKEVAKETLQRLMKEESKLVKGTFRCYETPGASVKITVRKYPGPKDGGIPHFERTMTDNFTYEVPLYVARHLNGIDVSVGAATAEGEHNTNIGTCSYAVHGFKFNGQGLPPAGQETYTPLVGDSVVPMTTIAKRVQRFGFNSNEFVA